LYVGVYRWNERHFGKFHAFRGGRMVPDANYAGRRSPNDQADWIEKKLFPPLVEQHVWDAVQKKLRERNPRIRSGISPQWYLSGLLYCGNCGSVMVAGGRRSPSKRALRRAARKIGMTTPAAAM